MSSTIKITLDDPELEPYKEHRWDAGVDLKSNNDDVTLEPGEQVKIHTGVRAEIPARYMGLIVPRSGLGSKYRMQLANTVGVIDSTYRGEIMVNVYNNGDGNIYINKYDRFCQLIIVPILVANYRVVSQLSGTARGEGGFGSTGEA
jgi:dUTP pyrophosphatase